MKISSEIEMTAQLNACLKASQNVPVVLTRKGKKVAVLLPITDEEELDRLVLAYDPKFQAILEKSRRQIEKTGGIPHDQFWREVEEKNRETAKASNGKRRQAKV